MIIDRFSHSALAEGEEIIVHVVEVHGDAVLDGEIDDFIIKYLRANVGGRGD